MPVGDLPGWHQVFADNFATAVPAGSFPGAVSTRWDAYPAGARDTSGYGIYYPPAITVHDGMLDLQIGWDGAHYLSQAPVPRLPTMLYGRFDVRYKAPFVHHYKTAWLLWPNSNIWPRDGEIDFPEGNLDSNICGFVHHLGATSGSDQDAFARTSPSTALGTQSRSVGIRTGLPSGSREADRDHLHAHPEHAHALGPTDGDRGLRLGPDDGRSRPRAHRLGRGL